MLAGLLTVGPIGCGDGTDDEGTTTTTATSATTSTSASATARTTTTGSTSSSAASTATTSTTTAESTTSGTESTTTASTTGQPTTTDATIDVDYVCGDGDTGSAEFSTGDIEEIDDFVNATDLCEFKAGLIEISFTAPCPSGGRQVTIVASDGTIPDIATLDLCENP